MSVVTKSSVLDVDKVSQIRFCFLYTLNKKAQQLSIKIRLVLNYYDKIRNVYLSIQKVPI